MSDSLLHILKVFISPHVKSKILSTVSFRHPKKQQKGQPSSSLSCVIYAPVCYMAVSAHTPCDSAVPSKSLLWVPSKSLINISCNSFVSCSDHNLILPRCHAKPSGTAGLATTAHDSAPRTEELGLWPQGPRPALATHSFQAQGMTLSISILPGIKQNYGQGRVCSLNWTRRGQESADREADIGAEHSLSTGSFTTRARPFLGAERHDHKYNNTSYHLQGIWCGLGTYSTLFMYQLIKSSEPLHKDSITLFSNLQVRNLRPEITQGFKSKQPTSEPTHLTAFPLKWVDLCSSWFYKP